MQCLYTVTANPNVYLQMEEELSKLEILLNLELWFSEEQSGYVLLCKNNSCNKMVAGECTVCLRFLSVWDTGQLLQLDCLAIVQMVI